MNEKLAVSHGYSRDAAIEIPQLGHGHTPWVVWGDNLQLMFSKISARLRFGLKHGRDVESWGEGIRLLEEWFYFGTDEPRIRKYRWMHKIEFLRRSTGIYRYQLGE